VTVAVRPEKASIKPFDGANNVYPGRVDEVVYIGTDTHYSVRLAGDHRVRIREQNDDPFSRPIASSGDEVKVYFEQAGARVLTE
jgi:spermidine/putrescine transport system ATP-binding protein